MAATAIFVVLFGLVGTAYGSCLGDTYYNPDGSTEVCDNGCCKNFCCFSVRDTVAKSEGFAIGYILLIIGIVIAKITFWCCICYHCCIKRRQQTVVIMQPTPTTTVHVNTANPMHAGYDQGAQANSPPPYSPPPKQTV